MVFVHRTREASVINVRADQFNTKPRKIPRRKSLDILPEVMGVDTGALTGGMRHVSEVQHTLVGEAGRILAKSLYLAGLYPVTNCGFLLSVPARICWRGRIMIGRFRACLAVPN